MIGVFSVVIMLGVSKWAEVTMMKSLWDLAKNQITIMPWSMWNEYNEWLNSNMPLQTIIPVKLTQDTVDYLTHLFPELHSTILFSIDSSTNITIKKVSEYVSYKGVSFNRLFTMKKKIQHGSYFTSSMFEQNQMVAILSSWLSKKYFWSKNPIGQKITLNAKNLTVIGVFADEDLWYDPPLEMYIPITTLQKKITNKKAYDSIIVSLDKSEDNRTWEKRLQYVLLKYYGYSTISEAGFYTSSYSSFMDELKKTQSTMKYLLLAIWSISLLVWGIWVMNIMLVSVTERTKEIGIRKALWALKKDIIIQFLIEAIFISLIGWILAIFLSYWVAFLVNYFLKDMWYMVIIDTGIVISALLVTCGVGVVFGILPARQAAQLRPIEALRFE